MNVLLVGDYHSAIHERACATALRELGHQVSEFAWCEYFGGYQYDRMARPAAYAARLQHHFVAGPALSRLNGDVVRRASAERPDLIFCYRPTHLFARTVDVVRGHVATGGAVIAYTNDDPFSPQAEGRVWRHFRSAIPSYDLHFAYRPHNVDDFRLRGARRVALLRSFFVPAVHRPVPAARIEPAFRSDVAFVGHYEPDRRLALIEAASALGYSFRLFGPGWEGACRREPFRRLSPVRSVWGDDYVKALCGTKIALCFLSTLNRDTYTRRCFEIPATGTFMLSQYSDDLASLFKEGVEAEFFRDSQEMIDKIHYYLSHETVREQVARSGLEAVWRGGHDVVSRMRQMLASVPEPLAATTAPH